MSESAVRPPSTISAALRHCTAALAAARVPSPEADALTLAGHVLGAERGRMLALAAMDAALGADDLGRLLVLTERRAAREPLQHILGRAPFRSLDLAVGPGVFVPRPETEIVAQLAIDALRAAAGAEPWAVDLGTGSGAIALSMAVEVPHARVVGVENAPVAFTWARQNFREVAAANARLVFHDLADAVPELDGTVAVVVSNPPYIPSSAIPRDPEVRRFDPPSALYGGTDGLDVVREVSHAATRLLHPGGSLVLEHGDDQGAVIRDLLAGDGWRTPRTHQDLTRRDRVTTALR